MHYWHSLVSLKFVLYLFSDSHLALSPNASSLSKAATVKWASNMHVVAWTGVEIQCFFAFHFFDKACKASSLRSSASVSLNQSGLEGADSYVGWK